MAAMNGRKIPPGLTAKDEAHGRTALHWGKVRTRSGDQAAVRKRRKHLYLGRKWLDDSSLGGDGWAQSHGEVTHRKRGLILLVGTTMTARHWAGRRWAATPTL